MQSQTGHACDTAYAAACMVPSEVCPKFSKAAKLCEKEEANLLEGFRG